MPLTNYTTSKYLYDDFFQEARENYENYQDDTVSFSMRRGLTDQQLDDFRDTTFVWNHQMFYNQAQLPIINWVQTAAASATTMMRQKIASNEIPAEKFYEFELHDIFIKALFATCPDKIRAKLFAEMTTSNKIYGKNTKRYSSHDNDNDEDCSEFFTDIVLAVECNCFAGKEKEARFSSSASGPLHHLVILELKMSRRKFEVDAKSQNVCVNADDYTEILPRNKSGFTNKKVISMQEFMNNVPLDQGEYYVCRTRDHFNPGKKEALVFGVLGVCYNKCNDNSNAGDCGEAEVFVRHRKIVGEKFENYNNRNTSGRAIIEKIRKSLSPARDDDNNNEEKNDTSSSLSLSWFDSFVYKKETKTSTTEKKKNKKYSYNNGKRKSSESVRANKETENNGFFWSLLKGIGWIFMSIWSVIVWCLTTRKGTQNTLRGQIENGFKWTVLGLILWCLSRFLL